MATLVSAQAYPLQKLDSLLEQSTDLELAPVLKNYIELQKDILAQSAKVASDGLISTILAGREALYLHNQNSVNHDDSTHTRLKSAALAEGVALYDLKGEQSSWRRRASQKFVQSQTRLAGQVLQQQRSHPSQNQKHKDHRPTFQPSGAPATTTPAVAPFPSRNRVRKYPEGISIFSQPQHLDTNGTVLTVAWFVCLCILFSV
jgi:hypothetical protein